MPSKERFLNEFSKAVADDASAIFIGAGVSMGAGYPSWKVLLKEIGDELGVRSDDVHDLTALAQWSIRKAAGKTQVLKVIRDEIGPDRAIPELLDIIARLPCRNLWTTNYDRLIERSFAAIGRPIDPISSARDLSIRSRAGATRLFKMHGTVDNLNDIVISTDDYELYRVNRGSFLTVLQAHMTSFSMLFVGLSFTDPNVRHVLAMIRESFSANPPEHFAIVRPPHRQDYGSEEQFKAQLTQHKLWAEDLLRYGLHVVEVDSYEEVPGLLREVERRIAKDRVWVSGSWPVGSSGTNDAAYVTEIARLLGKRLAAENYCLVTGGGLTVGSASISGFLDGLQRTGVWDLDRRLIARPFPQAIGNEPAKPEHWAALRKEMARVSGTVIFLGGAKEVGGETLVAEGVLAEFDAANKADCNLLPVSCTGQAAAVISTLGSRRGLAAGAASRWPTSEELMALAEKEAPEAVVESVMKILKRMSSGQ